MPAGITYETIATTTLTSASTSVTFSSIPGTYTDLILVTNVKTSANTMRATAITFRANGLTGGSDYGFHFMGAYNTSLINGYQDATHGVISWDVTPSEEFGTMTKTQFFNYANTAIKKSYMSIASGQADNSTYKGVESYIGGIDTTSAITSIEINLQVDSSKSFGIGSIFSLYGIKAA